MRFAFPFAREIVRKIHQSDYLDFELLLEIAADVRVADEVDLQICDS